MTEYFQIIKDTNSEEGLLSELQKGFTEIIETNFHSIPDTNYYYYAKGGNPENRTLKKLEKQVCNLQVCTLNFRIGNLSLITIPRMTEEMRKRQFKSS